MTEPAQNNTSMNQAALARVAAELFNITDPEVIDAFINEFVFTMLLD